MPRLTPALAQAVGTLRNDGTLALPGAPTVGNLMLIAIAGFGGNMNNGQAMVPPNGWQLVGIYFAFPDLNNAVALWQRRARTGDTGAVALSASDNHASVIYEYTNALGAYSLTGGPMTPFFTGGNYTLPIARSPFGLNDEVLVITENASTTAFTNTPATGLVIDYQVPVTADTRTASFVRSLPAHSRLLSGTLSGAPSTPSHGQFAVVGAFG